MRGFTAVIERCPDTGLYVGYVPGFPGAHSQAEALDELHNNFREVIEMLLEDDEPRLEAAPTTESESNLQVLLTTIDPETQLPSDDTAH